MEDLNLRSLRRGDLETVSRIWHASFGDAPEDVMQLLTLPGAVNGAVCAEEGGRVCGAMLAFDGLRLGGVRASYLYALCVAPEARGRGIGRAVYLETVRQAFSRGAELACIHAASTELERWYASFSETRILSGAVWERAPAAEIQGLTVRAVPPEEYAARRGGLEPELPDIMLRVQELFSPGSLMLTEVCGRTAPMCAEKRGSVLYVREPAGGEERRRLAAGAAFCLGAMEARLYTAGEGETNLMGEFAHGCRPGGEMFLPILLD